MFTKLSIHQSCGDLYFQINRAIGVNKGRTYTLHIIDTLNIKYKSGRRNFRGVLRWPLSSLEGVLPSIRNRAVCF